MKNFKKSDSKALKWILGSSKKYLPFVFLNAFFAAILAFCTVLSALASKRVLDIATKAEEGSLFLAGIILLFIVLLQVLLNSLTLILKDFSAAKLIIKLRNQIFSAITKRQYSDIKAYHSGDLLNRIVSDGEVVVQAVVNIIPSLISMLVQLIFGIIVMIMLERKIAFVIIAIGILLPLLGRIINTKFKSIHKNVQLSEGNSRSFIQECFENILIIKSFSNYVPFTNKLNEFLKKNFKFKMKKTYITVITHLGMYSFFTLGYYLILLWGSSKIASGIITFGTLTAFLQLVSQLKAPLQNIGGLIPQYYAACASAERLMELEDGEIEEPSMENEELEAILNDFKYIKADNVHFAYLDEGVLEGCSFSAERGKITAITGESGSGKSTVFKIILGLFNAQKGSITINDSYLLGDRTRKLFAFVPQGNMVLSGTIRENLTLCDDTISEFDLILACKTAEIYDFIESLPDGFDTVLSERGEGLSEGQIQRISIARAILTKAPILLFDEATSALDEATETKLLSNIKELPDKTVLFITHRNTSLKACDKIIRVENKEFITIKE